MKLIVEDRDLQRSNSIELERIEIVTDSSYEDRIEIYMLDDQGERQEGGTFSRAEFMRMVRQFYHERY
jgi:hypothetical protein